LNDVENLAENRCEDADEEVVNMIVATAEPEQGRHLPSSNTTENVMGIIIH
jgi:hypothetical protein